jgi:asparagine synthase (glutamine-hydrolysing)
MNFLAGWVGGGISDEATKTALDKMVKSSTKADVNMMTHRSGFVNCVANERNIINQAQCLLGVVGNSAIKPTHLQELVKRYQEQGSAFIQSIKEPFALVLADQAKQVLILATDAIGQRNLYYAQTPSGLVFGTTADSVIAHPEVVAELSLQTLYDYVYFHHCPSPTTIYKAVYKLEGGQMLVYQAGKISLSTYWAPQFTEQMEGSMEQAANALQHKLQQAVKRLSSTAEDTGAFLSGGLDSSSVAGALAQVFPGCAKSFTMGFPVEGYDETVYSRIAGQHFKLQQHEYSLTPDEVVAAVPAIAAYYDEPFGNSSALAAYYCAKMAKDDGIKVLLAGDGGDELFAGNERYARQGIFEVYHKIPRVLRGGLNGCLSILPNALQKGVLFKAKRYVDQANTPLPDRLQDYNFLHRHAASEIFAGSFIEQIDTSKPLQCLRTAYQKPEAASPLNRMMVMDWKTTLHDNDLVKVNKMCEMAGVEVQYPLLDQAIVELSCRIPSGIKLKGQQLRWFYKQAMQDFLPAEIINKSKHGFGLPFGIWLKDHQPLKELAYDSISSLKKRGYFRPEFLDHAITMHQSIHASYYGELIWVLMMLELWLQGKKR